MLYTGAQHFLATISKIICSDPSKSVIKSMRSNVERIRVICGGSKSGTMRDDVDDLSQELLVH